MDLPEARAAAGPAPGTPVPRVGSIVFARGASSESKPIDPSVQFPAGIDKIYAIVEVEGMKADDVLARRAGALRLVESALSIWASRGGEPMEITVSEQRAVLIVLPRRPPGLGDQYPRVHGAVPAVAGGLPVPSPATRPRPRGPDRRRAHSEAGVLNRVVVSQPVTSCHEERKGGAGSRWAA